ncbi:DeoR/GlpR family DNA-binding transcription regulator [Sporolactobacillus putidus]|uniref:DeoR family transcriptional regulator n=1 Tax=Sporolactobacillus putidus TaxID=492735 RepID=A0A917W4D0_9BACL|nr:DeoR/GlpR family DNA-binding transcription regulator [Sporolactobacillus putidus]GGL62136.1 DeoR family transcriptional regulator [Sporolactobacillus putidus]
MLAEERQQIILQKLKHAHVVKLQDLVRFLNASESTVRRDLQELESRHMLRRIHGGASLSRQRSEEPDMETKTSKYMRQKKMIAELAGHLVKDNECIYLDAGTTTLEMIPSINARNVTVVTNSPAHGEALVKKRIMTYLIGGMMKGTTKAIVGSIASQTLNLFRFDKAFIGVNGIDAVMGCTTPDPEEAALKRRARELAVQSFIVADSSKFSDVSFCKMFDIDQAAIITDKLPETIDPSILEKTKVICADAEHIR